MAGTRMPNILEASVAAMLKRVLKQDRSKVMFHEYVTSDGHRTCMSKLPAALRLPRADWSTHKNHDNILMPRYHVHFREEMQHVLSLLDAALAAGRCNAQTVRRVMHIFDDSSRGLSGHVSIEEGSVFPKLKRKHPYVDFSFLYESHTTLHGAQDKARAALRELADATSPIAMESLAAAVELVVRYDALLMQHLGEEEEIVVPMELVSTLQDPE